MLDEQVQDALSGKTLQALMADAATRRDAAFGDQVSYSRKVFIPVTRLCRDVCHYCTFATTPAKLAKAFLSPEDILSIARKGAAQGCKEALFTLGERPELRYSAARRALAELGYATTLNYVAAMARRVVEETGLLVHVNAGTMTGAELADMRAVTASMGLMLESGSNRLCEPGMAHHGSPDKVPALRWETLERAGELAIPTTTGLLIGIGETREERLADLAGIAALHKRHGHIQEVIIQNFLPKADTLMKGHPAAPEEELLWTIAAARLLLPASVSLQSPPNLNEGRTQALIAAGINDWGGVSPVTPDHVNPEAPWPAIARLADETAAAGKQLVERLCLYPSYVHAMDRWCDKAMRAPVHKLSAADGFAHDLDWFSGSAQTSIHIPNAPGRNQAVGEALDALMDGAMPVPSLITPLFDARGEDFDAVCVAANDIRRDRVGDTVTYVVNRNINYTNICQYRCAFCAFAKGKTAENLRGPAYRFELPEIVARAEEAWARGATEVCLQGGIHPHYTGETYLNIVRAIRTALPDIHIHAFSPLEIHQGAQTLGWTLPRYLSALRDAGLGSLPGTAAEILDDEVRKTLCPDKLSTQEWLDVVECAHEVGLKTTSTIMFGHMETPLSWAKHLLHLLHLQRRTGGISEFVPLPFVHMESPIYLQGKARRGPTLREAILMHAVARLVFQADLPHIQVSWVKMGQRGSVLALGAGADDLGGVLMDETISRAAGASHGSSLQVADIKDIAKQAGRPTNQRSTLYGNITSRRGAKAITASPLKATA